MRRNRIRELRKEIGITQEQLAKLLNINRATLSRYESGEIDPPSSQLQRISDVLHVPVDYLLGYVNDPFFYLDLERIAREINSHSDDELIPENRIATAMAKLNETGKHKAADIVELFAEIPRYQAETTPEPPAEVPRGTDTPTTEPPPERPQEGGETG